MTVQDAVWQQVDAAWYRCAYPIVEQWLSEGSIATPEAAWFERGRLLGHDPNAYFAERWYLARYPGVAEAVAAGEFTSGFDHFCRHGQPDFSPHWLFDPTFYRESFARLSGRSMDPVTDGHPFEHFIKYGQQNGLSGHRLFDRVFYAAYAPCSVRWRINQEGPFTTFLMQVRDPVAEPVASPHFDPSWYRQRYPEVTQGIREGRWLCALHHYITTDQPGQCDPSPRFSEAGYLTHHREVRLAVARGEFRNGFDHFLRHGAEENRYFEPAADDVPPLGSWPEFPLSKRVFPNVSILPVAGDPAKYDLTFGVHDAGGQPIPEANNPWLAQRQPVEAPTFVLKEAIYGGQLMSHFGHMLLDSLCRLWFIRQRPDLPILWHWVDLPGGHDNWPSWFDELWWMIGLDCHTHHRVTAPLRVERLIIPASGLTAPYVMHPLQAQALATRDPPSLRRMRRVWLSRARLPSRFGAMVGETEVEARLAARGWTIICPETLPVAQQVDLFASEDVIAGIIGSAFHAASLSRCPSARLILVNRPIIDHGFYEAIARVLGIRQAYLEPALTPNDGFADPVALADDIERLADRL